MRRRTCDPPGALRAVQGGALQTASARAIYILNLDSHSERGSERHSGPRSAFPAATPTAIRPSPPRRTPEPAPCPNQCVPVSRGYRHRHAANAVNALVARDIHAYHRSDYISAGRGQNACPQEESNGAATSDEIPVFARKLAEDSEQGRNGRSTERRQRHNGRSRHRRIDNETQKAQIHAKLKLRNRK